VRELLTSSSTTEIDGPKHAVPRGQILDAILQLTDGREASAALELVPTGSPR